MYPSANFGPSPPSGGDGTPPVVQGQPVDGTPAVPFGVPVLVETQARRYQPLDREQQTGHDPMRCFLAVLRFPIALLLALNYAIGFVLVTAGLAVVSLVLLVWQVVCVPFYAICTSRREFQAHWSAVCSCSRQRAMLAPHPVGRQAAVALREWAAGGDASFAEAVGGCGGCCCIHPDEFNPYNTGGALLSLLFLLGVPAAYVYWCGWVLGAEAAGDDAEELDALSDPWPLGAGVLVIVAWCWCVAVLCGADDGHDIVPAVSAGTIVSVVIPLIIVYIAPAWLALREWEEDNPVKGAALNWVSLAALVVLLCACCAACF